jgi:branched-chain amino acid transport system ATP-binding protein
MRELLSCRDVHKSYGGVSVLRGVELGVGGGEILGLIGANGAGKSTLIDIISGLTPLSSGDILIDNVSVLDSSVASRAQRGLARTFQRPQIASQLTLRENILTACASAQFSSIGRSLSGFISGFFHTFTDRDEDVDEICAILGLRDPERLAAEVTLGELRLVEFARALMQKPRVIILDEPLSGVGDTGIAGIIDALQTLRKTGCAVLLVDHNIDLITPLVDRMVLISQGEILVEGDVETCLASDVFRTTYIGVV